MIQDEELRALKQRWLASGSFKDEQTCLAARVRRKDVGFVYLDPDGSLAEWIAIVVRRETGVVYGTQCAGVATGQRYVEGYLVPVGGSKYDVDEGNIDVGQLVEVFHDDGGCRWDWTGRALPLEQQARLRKLVESIPYWIVRLDGGDQKDRIRVDDTRVEEIAEGWIPVRTPDGPGVLVYRNCD